MPTPITISSFCRKAINIKADNRTLLESKNGEMFVPEEKGEQKRNNVKLRFLRLH